MALITWYRKYSVNNEELDNQHKKLFAIFNRLYEVCLHEESSDCINAVINELNEYADCHFKAEEKYMLDIGYEGVKEHRELHGYFSDRVKMMEQVENKEDYDYKKELIVFLGNWILRHVTVEDKKYSVSTGACATSM